MRFLRRMGEGSSIVVLCLAVSCGPSKGKGKVGAFCDNDSDCESGLCFENQCLDPDGDEDGDSLKNGIEAHQTGTDPLRADTDNDGLPDGPEVGDIASATDTDGDGLADALESSLMLADPDQDCLPDQFDPHNDAADSGMERQIAALFCQKGGGVCSESLDAVLAACVEGEVQCDYSAVPGYEETETLCDQKDNDCDGQTDAGLTSTSAGTCVVEGVCGAPGASVPRDCVDGVWECRYSVLPDWEEVETRFDGLDNDCDGETDEGMAGQPCQVENEFGACPGTRVFRDGAEVCDGPEPAAEACDDADNDCDGETDEGLTSSTQGECSNLGVCGTADTLIPRECRNGQWVCLYEQVPGYEAEESRCDGLDNDCDGESDEGLAGVACENQNEFGTCAGLTVCDGQGGVACGAPVPASEACDTLDNDCNDLTDEGLDGLPCDITNEYGTCQGATSCAGGQLACLGPVPAAEACNGQDDDCNGLTDDGLDGFPCENTNQYGTCPGLTLCLEGQASCDGRVPAKDVCNQQDDNCDGQTDENDICLKTSSVQGTVRDGATSKPVAGARVDFYPGQRVRGAPGDRREQPADTLLTDGSGRFEVSLIPGPYWVEVQAVGYQPARTWTFVLVDQDQMPLDITLTPEGGTAWFVSVCGRVYEGVGTNLSPPVEGASVTLFGNGFDNPLASATSGPQGFYCISGVSGTDSAGSPFEGFGLKASKSGYLPGMVESIPNEPNTVFIEDIVLSTLPPGTQTLLHEDFENPQSQWTMDEPASGVGWQWLSNGEHVNQAAGACVMLPAQYESCVKDPADPLDRCAICENPADAACIPTPGALPNAYAGSGAFWFGNPASANFLVEGGTCDPLSGGTGGPVGGSLVSPWIPTGYANPLSLSFYSAWEIESVDPQGPPGGYDQMLVEAQGGAGASGEWVLVGSLNPAVDVNGEAYQPYTSGGFNQAPIWVNYVFDLTPFASLPEIRIRFRFDSKDEQYNGFRGWLVDEVEVFGVVPAR